MVYSGLSSLLGWYYCEFVLYMKIGFRWVVDGLFYKYLYYMNSNQWHEFCDKCDFVFNLDIIVNLCETAENLI